LLKIEPVDQLAFDYRESYNDKSIKIGFVRLADLKVQ